MTGALGAPEVPDVWVLYTNWRGETGWRHIRPIRLFLGPTLHHPTRGYILLALDLDKKAERDFVMTSVLSWRDEPPDVGAGGLGGQNP